MRVENSDTLIIHNHVFDSSKVFVPKKSQLKVLWYFSECCSNIQVTGISGDQDSVIPLTGSRTLVQGLANQLGLKSTVPYRVWFGGQQVMP